MTIDGSIVKGNKYDGSDARLKREQRETRENIDQKSTMNKESQRGQTRNVRTEIETGKGERKEETTRTKHDQIRKEDSERNTA